MTEFLKNDFHLVQFGKFYYNNMMISFFFIWLHGFLSKNSRIKHGNMINLLLAIERLPSLESLAIYDYPEAIPHESFRRQVECHENLQYLYIGSSFRVIINTIFY